MFLPHPGLFIDQIRQNTYLTLSWERMIFVHSNFTVHLKISQAVITNSFVAKYWGWNFCPIPGIDKSDQNRQNTYLAVSWQLLVFVHSNFTDYLRIAQAIITNSFRAKCSGWHFHPTPAVSKIDQIRQSTYLTISWERMIFVHSNFTVHLKISQAVITNSFVAKYWGWNFCPTPGIDKSDQNRKNTYLAVSWQISVFVHSNFTDYLRIAQAIITNSFRAKCSGWHFHPTPAVNKIDQIRQNTYLTISWERMIFVHSNFTVHRKISQAVITNSFVAKYWGWNFCPTPGIDKSDQNRQNTYLAVSWQLLVFVHSNFTDYLRIAQAIITNSFRAKCSGWHFHPTLAVSKIDQIRQNTYLTISWKRMIFVHSNFTDLISQAVITNSFVAKYSGWNFCTFKTHIHSSSQFKISQAVITNSFVAKYSGWNFCPTPGIDKSDQNRQNTYLAVSWQLLVFVHSNFTDYLRIAQAIITNSFRAKCSGWHFHPTPAVSKIDQIRQSTYLTISWERMIFVHPNLTVHLKISQAVITNSFVAKYWGWNFCPTPGIDKSDQNRQNTYLAVSWQKLVFVHSNFTDYLRIAQAIITNSFRAKCSGWHFHPTPAVNKIDQIRQNTYLTISWERMIFVHSNFTVHRKISQAVITNSFVAKYWGWNFCPTPGIDKSDQNRQNTYLAVSWQLLVFVHSNFTWLSQNSTSNHYK